jgi:uncharacterized protein (DUF486 family)
MLLEEALMLDALMLVVSGILIFLTYNAASRLAKSPKPISLNVLAGLRIVTWGEIVVLTYALIDIPWNFILQSIPGVSMLDILKYVIVYAIIVTIIVLPIINALLGVPLTELEKRRRALLAKREELMQEMRIITTKYLKQDISETTFRDISREIQGKLASIEAKLERMRMQTVGHEAVNMHTRS